MDEATEARPDWETGRQLYLRKKRGYAAFSLLKEMRPPAKTWQMTEDVVWWMLEAVRRWDAYVARLSSRGTGHARSLGLAENVFVPVQMGHGLIEGEEGPTKGFAASSLAIILEESEEQRRHRGEDGPG